MMFVKEAKKDEIARIVRPDRKVFSNENLVLGNYKFEELQKVIEKSKI